MCIIPSGLKQPRAKHITAEGPGELCLFDLYKLTSLNEIVTSFSLSFLNQQCYKNCTVCFVKVTIRLLCMFLTCICSILKYQNHSFEKCNTLEHTNLGNKLIVQIILNLYIWSQLCCSLKISSWEGFSQTSCKFKLNFYKFKALLVTYWSFDRSKIGFFLCKTKAIVPFRNVSMVELVTLLWFKHFYFVCTA